MTEMAKTPETLFIHEGYNCAETTLIILNERFELGLTEEEIRLVSGFGGGMASGKTCGILCGAIAALSKYMVTDRAHATPNFREACANCVAQFEQKFGNTDCAELKKDYFKEGTRCLHLVGEAIELIEDYMGQLK